MTERVTPSAMIFKHQLREKMVWEPLHRGKETGNKGRRGKKRERGGLFA